MTISLSATIISLGAFALLLSCAVYVIVRAHCFYLKTKAKTRGNW